MKVEATHASLWYDRDKEHPTIAVSEVDMSILPGETVGLMGPSGSGKTSLLYLLAGLRRPQEGAVYWDGQDIAQAPPNSTDAQRMRRVGMIFQQPFLIAHLNILENILLPLPRVGPEDLSRALAWLDAAGLSGQAEAWPDALSIGARQRVAILRAMIHLPEVIFADEPTAALDWEAAGRMMQLLRQELPEASLVMVTHDYKVLVNATRIHRLRDGKLEGQKTSHGARQRI